MGVNPGPLTLRELIWMADAKGRDEWNRTAALLSLFANAYRDPKKGRVFKPADFNPYGEEKIVPKKVKDLSILKAVFVDRELK